MKLTTIWTIPACSLGERLRRTVDLAAMTAARLLPARVRYWTFIQVGSKAMAPNDIVPEVRFMDLLKNADGGPK
ncbi:MAG: hypothetical protein M3536_09270 [Actinomycetota bacterium]|nr:hypothetical protein [Actinomycetota bacterium]